jgi:hypothetical protein
VDDDGDERGEHDPAPRDLEHELGGTPALVAHADAGDAEHVGRAQEGEHRDEEIAAAQLLARDGEARGEHQHGNDRQKQALHDEDGRRIHRRQRRHLP